MNKRVMGACFLISLAILCGCGKPVTWNYSLGGKNGNTVLDMTGVAFIFMGESITGGASGTATIWQPTIGNPLTSVWVASSSSGSGKDKFDSSYAKKVQTLMYRGHAIVIKDAGRKVEIDGQAFDLKGNKKTFLIPKTGQIAMREYVAEDFASPVPEPEKVEAQPTQK